ncbi:MAG: DUF4105 domain-containing protein [Gammaproteobacteria bacterium]|nr:DUF4105 domain-containing protein [Gammaproteobacteria bacterium]
MRQSKVFVISFGLVFFSKLIFANDNWFADTSIIEAKEKQLVSFLFVSQNLKSPASMFGHTLIVLHNNKPPEPDAIVVEFLGDTSRIAFAKTKALLGTIPGHYKLNRFLYKQREYELENRDLWIYRIKLNGTQRQRFFNQLENDLEKEFAYNFSFTNCSYFILKLLNHSAEENRRPIIFPLVLPVHTLRIANNIFEFQSVQYMPSTQRKLINAYEKLNNKEKKYFANVLSGLKVDNKLVEASHIRTALSLAINYRSAREKDKNKRNTLFYLKKTYHTPLLARYIGKNPLYSAGETSINMGRSLGRNEWVLSIKPFQRDFFSAVADGLETSYLDILKVNMTLEDNRFGVRSFNLVKLHSVSPSSLFAEGFNRYIEASYYDRSNLSQHSQAHESVIRMGGGFSSKLSKRFKIASMPYLGIRIAKTDTAKSNYVDLGIVSSMSAWLSDNFRIETVHTHYFNSPFDFNEIIHASAIVDLSKHFSLATKLEVSEKIVNNGLMIIGVFKL